MRLLAFALPVLAALALPSLAPAQDRLQTMPRYDRYEKIRREIGGAVTGGNLAVRWADDGKSFTFTRDGKRFRYDIAGRKAIEEGEAERPAAPRRGPARGRQHDRVDSPDGNLIAVHVDRNVVIRRKDGGGRDVVVTTGGSEKDRVKYGIASWVYGEELGVRDAMWWSPDSKRLAYYRFDESEVKDYHLALDQTKFQTRLDVEAYPKAGTPNPKVELHVYDLERRESVKVDATFGGDPELAHYVYSVRWSPDGKELLFNRTNRKQNVMQFCAADPATGRARVILEESRPNSWTDNSPPIRFLADNQRFIWTSERNGYRNLYLYDLSGKLHRPLTQHPFEVGAVVQVDEERGQIFYTARSGDNPYLMQLHRVGLDGRGDRRLTDPAFSHSATVAPGGRHFVSILERADAPPVTRLYDAQGRMVDELAVSDLTKFRALNLRPVERFRFLAADGKTELYGNLHFPGDFDPSKRYPLVVSVYAGPDSGGRAESFQTPNAITEMGFLVASFEGRGTTGRGKAFKEALYGKLGIVEVDDQAAGVKALRERPYVDGGRVGIYGTSYGGYASIMALLRYPDVFHAASASSSVTDWRHYDTIYTERYQGLPWEGENLAGYDAGSANTYVKNLRGRLMLFYGTVDNNVHPANTLMLAHELNRAGKSYEMMVGPDLGHVGINQTRMWEFFMDHLMQRR
jgi:dipeptidyl-peptidase 4